MLHNASLVSDNDVDDKPQDVDSHVLSTDKHLSMLLEGCTCQQRLRVQILLDTGASSNFVSPRLLQELSLSSQPTEAKLRLADNSEASILGRVKLKLKVQHSSADVVCFVTDLCQEF